MAKRNFLLGSDHDTRVWQPTAPRPRSGSLLRQWTTSPFCRRRHRVAQPCEPAAIRKRLSRLAPCVRRELLFALTREPHVRADLIRQFYERPETRDLAEVLMDLETDDALRWRLVDELLELDR